VKAGLYLELRKSGWKPATALSAMSEIRNRELSSRVIEAAIAVHTALGPGFIESVYENAMCIELSKRGIAFERQKSVPIIYHGAQVGEHRLDLFVGGSLVVELKAVSALEDVFFAIGRSYMKAVGVEDGLLLNFAAMPLMIRRIGRERAAGPVPSSSLSS
jgi:GxxExxY protein